MNRDAAGASAARLRLRMNAAAVFARASVRVRASFRESSWVVGETLFPFLAMSAFVLVYRGLRAPREYEGFVVLGGAMIAYWNNVIWGMASQFFWEKEQGQLQLYLISPVSRMSILLGMALGGIVMTTTRAAAILIGGMLLFHVSLPLSRALPAFGLFVLTLGAAYSLGMILSSLFLLWGREVWHTATLLQEPVYLFSGFYFPVSAMGIAIGIAGSILPVTLGLDGIRQVFYGPAAHGLLPLGWIPPIQIALTLVFVHLARVSLLAMENLGKREGRLTLKGD
ncbi:MAG: ABC transporter permease [Candidatus Eisenbacteria bacterium]|uniref:ABC transporter permease n=1 Tax=Eiseniibacteriota bacterium TaxID=2212470 RepID=A0A538T107_UNCEI|nr:MAG: ABC transporter permease [Candidatus Eisenbacteria bacterium]